MRVPIVIRMIVGRGWGQGPQHSQALHAWFAHIPGLKVIMPTTPHDAKGMLLAAIDDDAPVICIEHRWLYGIRGEVPEGKYTVPLDKGRVARAGKSVTIAATSYAVLDSLRAAELLAEIGIEAEVLDLRSLTPLDEELILSSLSRTGHLVAVDIGQLDYGVSAQVVSMAAEKGFQHLRSAPTRVALPQIPTPTSPALAEHFYPTPHDIARAALRTLGAERNLPPEQSQAGRWSDVPDPTYTGPY